MLNPSRDTLNRVGLEAMGRPSPFQAQAELAVSGFAATRLDLERQVRRGDLTLKVARERAATIAGDLKTRLGQQAEGYSPTPRAFLDRLVDAVKIRKTTRESLSMEGLQRETNRLLRLNLFEQQLKTRAGEFEGRTFVRSVAGGPAVPTLESLLGYHKVATDSGDEVALEWTRRQLEEFRNRVFSPDDIRRIDLATDRPERVNLRLVNVYREALKDQTPDELETFVERAQQEQDSNACIAAFVMARETPDGLRHRWVRKVLSRLDDFPDAALSTLRSLEAEARAEEASAAQAQAQQAIARLETESSLPGLITPTAEELARDSRIQAKPVARPGQAIGLALDLRGALGTDPEVESEETQG